MSIYKQAIIFGTFDQLHKGHRSYIKRAFELSDKVLIMVMSDEATRPTKIYTPFSFEKRCHQIREFAKTQGWDNSRFKIDTWHDRHELYKRMVDKPLADVVLTGHEYLDRTYEMFQARLQLGLDQFTIILHPRYRENDQEITSTLIRLSLNKKKN